MKVKDVEISLALTLTTKKIIIQTHRSKMVVKVNHFLKSLNQLVQADLARMVGVVDYRMT